METTTLAGLSPPPPDGSTDEDAESWIITVLGIMLWLTLIVIGIVCARVVCKRDSGRRRCACRQCGCRFCHVKCSDASGTDTAADGRDRSEGSLSDVISYADSLGPPSYRRAVSMPRPSVLAMDSVSLPPDYDQLFLEGAQPDAGISMGYDNVGYTAAADQGARAFATGGADTTRDTIHSQSFLRSAGLIGSHVTVLAVLDEITGESLTPPPPYEETTVTLPAYETLEIPRDLGSTDGIHSSGETYEVSPRETSAEVDITM